MSVQPSLFDEPDSDLVAVPADNPDGEPVATACQGETA